MRLRLLGIMVGGFMLYMFAGTGVASAQICGITATAPTYKHVILIMEENNSYGSIVGSPSAPYINRVISFCGLATNYHNISHPSLPNYIAITDGNSLEGLKPFYPDCTPSATCESTTNNIFEEATKAGGEYKGYAESMPSPCDKTNAGFYAARHNPAVYYTDLTNCASQDVALGTLSNSPLLQDFSSEATAPAFATVTPNLCDDMHGAQGCPTPLITDGDNWLKSWLPRITETPVYASGDTAIFVVWDEGEPETPRENCAAKPTDESCHVPAIVIAPSVKAGTQVSTLFNHYSVLKTTEDLLGLPEIGDAKTAASMLSAFNL